MTCILFAKESNKLLLCVEKKYPNINSLDDKGKFIWLMTQEDINSSVHLFKNMRDIATVLRTHHTNECKTSALIFVVSNITRTMFIFGF